MLQSGLQRLKDFPRPFWVALFVEGTRFTKTKLLAAQEFASSQGLPIPRNVLIPRTKVKIVILLMFLYVLSYLHFTDYFIYLYQYHLISAMVFMFYYACIVLGFKGKNTFTYLNYNVFFSSKKNNINCVIWHSYVNCIFNTGCLYLQGFVSSVSNMREFVPAIYDVTVAIPKDSSPPTMLRILNGKSSVVRYQS